MGELTIRERILIKELVVKEKKFFEQILEGEGKHNGSNIIEKMINDYNEIIEKLKFL